MYNNKIKSQLCYVIIILHTVSIIMIFNTENSTFLYLFNVSLQLIYILSFVKL